MASAKTVLQKIPVTVVTGFLGSGKTTLINNILKGDHGKRIAVIENEYGEVGIDDALVLDTKEEIFEMNNGCICCTVRGDLIRTLNKLLRRRNKFDSVLIETTGLADPAPVAQTFFVDEDVRDGLSLDSIVAVVDAKHVLQHVEEEKPDGVVNEAVQQIAFADKILLNKTDLVSPKELRTVEEAIRRINKPAEIIECTNCNVDLDRILGQKAFDLEKMLDLDPGFLGETGKTIKKGHDHEHEHDHEHHDHSHGTENCEACKHDHEHEHDHDHDHDHDHEHEHHDHSHGTENCEACKHEHEHDHDHSHHHHHDTRVSSVGIIEKRPVDLNRFNVWLSTLLQSRGPDLYRTKGILNVQGSDDKYVFHGVHMMMTMAKSSDGVGKPWKEGEARESRIIFIGKDLDRELLTDGFQRCLVNTETEKKQRTN